MSTANLPLSTMTSNPKAIGIRASTSTIESTVWRELWRSHGAVILQHDVQGPRSLNAVPAIIAGLRARGYSFITPAGGKPLP